MAVAGTTVPEGQATVPSNTWKWRTQVVVGWLAGDRRITPNAELVVASGESFT